jgi:hypothetical protein
MCQWRGEVGPSGTDVMILKIFLPKKLQKIGIFDSKTKLNYAKFDHNIGFCEKRLFFHRK